MFTYSSVQTQGGQMLSLYLTILRFFKAIYHSAKDKEFRALAVITIILLLSGTLFYSSIENWSLLDSLYFCVMTMTTIGYGDLTPTTDISKIFTIIYAFLTIGIFVSLAAKLATGLMQNYKKH
jgi:voltage-gated potassium channel Kch